MTHPLHTNHDGSQHEYILQNKSVNNDEDGESSQDETMVWDDARPLLKILNFFIGDMRDGVTMINMQTFYLLTVLDFDHDEIKRFVLAFGVCQFSSLMLSGLLYDATPSKALRWLQSSVVINCACVLLTTFIAWSPKAMGDHYGICMALLLLVKCVQGAASAFVPTGVSAITLGIVGLSNFSEQHKINRIYAHMGSATIVLFMSVLGSFLYADDHHAVDDDEYKYYKDAAYENEVNEGSLPYIFLTSVLITLFIVLSLRRIRRSDVNSDAARGLIVESPTFLGYEGYEAKGGSTDEDDDDEFLSEDYEIVGYQPPKSDTTISDKTRENIGDLQQINAPRRARSFLDRTNEMKKVPSVVLQNMKNGAHRRIKSLKDTIRRKTKTPLEMMLEKNFLMLVYVLFLFHLSNTSITPLVMYSLDVGSNRTRTRFLLSGSVVVIAQGFMVLSSKFAGDYTPLWGRKQLMVVGLFSLPLRCALLVLLLYIKDSIGSNSSVLEALILSTQLIDAIGMGIVDTIYILVASDVSAKSGRFSLVIGCTTAAASLGGTLSSYIGQSMAHDVGMMSAFGLIGLISLVPAFLYLTCMPETLPDYAKYSQKRKYFGWLKKADQTNNNLSRQRPGVGTQPTLELV